METKAHPSSPLPSLPTAKRAYRAPRLTVFGTVRSLTASGTGIFPETRRNPGEDRLQRI